MACKTCNTEIEQLAEGIAILMRALQSLGGHHSDEARLWLARYRAHSHAYPRSAEDQAE